MRIVSDAKIFEGKRAVTCIYVKERVFFGAVRHDSSSTQYIWSQRNNCSNYMIEVHGCTWPHSISSEEIVSCLIAQPRPLLIID